MKKTIGMMVMAVLLLTHQSNAQLQKGNVLMGGDIAKINFNLNSGHAFQLAITPKAAWFIRNNLAVGAYVNFGLTAAKGISPSINYGVGPLARFYFSGKEVNLLQHARIFLEGNAGIEGSNPSGDGDNTNGLGLGFGPGVAYFITPNIGLEGLIKYNGIVGFGTAATSNILSYNLGFQVYLPSAKLRREAKAVKKEVKDKM